MSKKFHPADLQWVDRTAQPDRFFAILPDDWQEIVPVWGEYPTASIFTLENGGEVIGGGIVFRSVSPDTQYYADFAQAQFDAGYWYLAYIWIAEAYRGQGLGTEWLHRIHAQYPGQRFWLTIVDPELGPFYVRCGYVMGEEIAGEDGREWVLRRKG